VLIATTDPGTATNHTGLVLLAVLALVLYLGQRAATGRRNARTCARYGHAPDPETVGTRGERCARCGTRLR
jgi:hypothetical protein